MYKILTKQIEELIEEEPWHISVFSNVSALLFETMENINWAGFYIVRDGKLLLGPFQGKPACIQIGKGKGVCGTSFERKETIIVSDVNKFDGHIACSSLSKREIVVPIIKDNEVKAVIDIDSPIDDRFHDDDKVFIEEVANVLSKLF